MRSVSSFVQDLAQDLSQDLARGATRLAWSVPILLLLSLVFLPSVWAEKPPAKSESVNPGINARYLAPDMKVEEWVERFEGESREIFVARQAITEAVQLKPGATIADIGAGTGLFTALFAHQVGAEGQVYAVDIAPKFVAHLRDRVAETGFGQVMVVLGQEDSITLPKESIDVAFVCDVYHHFEYPQASLASIYRALRSGGTFVVIDFERIPGKSPEWIFDHVRAGKEVVTKEVQTAGFQLLEEVSLDGLTENYFLRFAKP